MAVESEEQSQRADAGDENELPRWGALAYPNYRRYWFSSLALVFGMQFRFIGGGWLIHTLAPESPLWLAAPGVVTVAVTLVLTVPAGALADRVDTQRLLVVGRGLTTVTHLVLAIVIVTGLVHVWTVLVWAAVAGALAALTGPAQNALLPRLIDRRAMASAVAYTSAIWNSMRIIGPAAAAVVIAVVGIGQAFFVLTGGFVISTLLVASLKLSPVERRADEGEHEGMLAGVRYILAHQVFFATIGLSFFTSIFGLSYVILLPIFADEILNAGVTGFGALEAAAGVGALLGTLAIVRVGTGRHAGTIMIVAAALFGLWIAAFAGSRSMALSMALLFAGGFCSSVYLNLGMTILQLQVPDAVRGRVMGVWGLTWLLSAAGGAVAGGLATWLGTPLAVAIGALAVSAFAVGVYIAFGELRRMPPLEAGRRASAWR